MLVIPTRVLPNQSLQVQLGDHQPTTLNIYQLAYGMFMDVYVSGHLIIGGVICQNLNRIVRSVYLGFAGDFMWTDIAGTDDPDYTGLGSRFILIYLESDDLPPGAG